jgi:hypothetical protein
LKNKWTQQEFERAVRLLSGGWTPAEIAKTLARTETAVRLKLIKSGYSSRTIDIEGECAPDVIPDSAKVNELQKPLPSHKVVPNRQFSTEAARELLEIRDSQIRNRRERAEAIELAQRERLLEAFRQAVQECRFSCTIEPPRATPNPRRQPHAAVLLISDTHVGKVCSPRETEGRAIYNPAQFVARLGLLERGVAELLQDGPPIDELVVILLGDIVEGCLDHGAEREENLLLSHQFVLATHLLAQFLMRLAGIVPTMRVFGLGGNHSRWPGQRRSPTTGRESNLDHLVYRGIEMIAGAAGIKNLHFQLGEASRQTIRVKSSVLAALHGDQIRGGEFFTAGIKREVYSSVLRRAPNGDLPDLWVTGDKHVPQSLSVGTGRWVINGAFVGEDTYSQQFAPARASQTLMWICPEKGRFLLAEINLHGASPMDTTPYEIPPSLKSLIAPYIDEWKRYEN